MSQENTKGRSYYNEFSSWYERERHRGYHRMIDELEVDLALPLCRDKDILEAGCGTGLLLKEFATVARRATGLDISQGMAKQARERGLNVVLGSVTDLPFPDASFDVVISCKVLAHIPDISRAISELSRVTRPGGKLLLEFYNRQSLRYAAKSLAGPQRISEAHHEGEMFTRWETPQQMLARLPDELQLLSWHGVRIVTPAAFFCKIPLLSSAISYAERSLRDGPFARFGGFFLLLLEKRA
jgi:ubiquinone/menaquinone biosynthesis C-methylase UbiE